jgi:SDR family mycofactocin-dependent oxidoreductase
VAHANPPSREEPILSTLAGQVALVTGAARGQGRSHALALAEAGADVALLDLCGPLATTPYPPAGAADLRETADRVRALGRKAHPVEVDLRDLDATIEAVASTRAILGEIDIAVINHGIWSRGGIFELSEEQWNEMIDVNLSSVWKALRAVAPSMVERRSGSVVITASVAGLVGVPGSAHYTAAKHGVIGLMRAAAVELGPYGIRVNAVCPGLVDTAMTDWQGCYDMSVGHEGGTRAEFEDGAQHINLTGGLIQPSEISAAVLWLVAPAAAQVTGVALPVDGGNLVLPGVNPGPFLLPTKRRGSARQPVAPLVPDFPSTDQVAGV